MSRLSEMNDLQIDLHLLRYIHNTRFTYSFQFSSGQASKELAQAMMKATRKTLAAMLECDEISDASWQQALQPKGPGLGLTDLETLAPYMVYASILEASEQAC